MKKKKSFWKQLNAQLHLWLGLASGLIVLIVSVTGCVWTFQEEITNVTDHKLLFVTPESRAALPVSVLKQKAEAALGKPVDYITTYTSPDRAWEFMCYKASGMKNPVWALDEVAFYQSAYINPYTGQVTGVKDFTKDFFVIIKQLHWSLLLANRIGQPIVGWSVVIFVILLITGLILWWPKKWNKKSREQSFKIKWSGNFKRVNYDLHNVLGFYSLLLALVLGLTGMVFAFEWFQKTVYVVATQSVTPPQHPVVASDSTITGEGLDFAYYNTLKAMPGVHRIGLSPAGPEKAATISASGYWDDETYYNRDDLQFDKSTGKLLLHETRKDLNAGEKIANMNFDIHVGAIGGLPGKIIAFIISLICASLPVTGLMVWLNKGKKTKKKPVIHEQELVNS
jgi:uncharacterized iron-regulated membrane protein